MYVIDIKMTCDCIITSLCPVSSVTWVSIAWVMLKSKLSLFVVLLQLWTMALSTNESSCIDNCLDFEEQTFDNNSENRVKLYQAFYPPNDHLPYSVVVTYQAVLPNGTKVNISTDSSCPDWQVW